MTKKYMILVRRNRYPDRFYNGPKEIDKCEWNQYLDYENVTIFETKKATIKIVKILLNSLVEYADQGYCKIYSPEEYECDETELEIIECKTKK